jgi:hypothetical protein
VTANDKPEPASADAPARRPLTPEAQRALAEAEERRRQRDAEAATTTKAKELGGRAGPDPARYGDWENGGIASDF